MAKLIPVGERVLVQLGEQYRNIAVTEKKYDSKTNGIIVAVGDPDARVTTPKGSTAVKSLIGKRIYWDQFKEGAAVLDGESQYCFINIEDIQGVEVE